MLAYCNLRSSSGTDIGRFQSNRIAHRVSRIALRSRRRLETARIELRHANRDAQIAKGELMKIISEIITALLPLAAGAATLIVPAAGTGPGAYNSDWRSELTLHNTSATALTVGVKFHDRNGAQDGDDIQVGARSTLSIEDIVATRFGRESAVGALELTIDDAAANKVAVTSRAFNRSAAGQFGQDVPALHSDAADVAGQTV